MDAQRSYPKPPRCLQYEDGGQQQEFSFSSAKFSEDSKYVACFSSRIHVGVIIYDWRVERIVSTIHTKNVIASVSFNPTNSTRLCVGGACGMFQFWHFTSKSVYSAPITGFNRSDVTYTAHTWMDPDAVVTGTDRGTLHLVVGCEAKSFFNAFGISAGYKSTHVAAPVSYIISKGNTIVAASSEGCVSVCKYSRQEGRGGSITIKLESFFTLQDMPNLTGITWADRNLDSMILTATSSTVAQVFQLPLMDVYHQQMRDAAALEGQDFAAPSSPSSVTPGMNSCSMLKYRVGAQDEDDVGGGTGGEGHQSGNASDARVSFRRATSSGAERSTQSMRLMARWPYLLCQRVLANFHSGDVKTLVTTPRASVISSLSSKDNCVMLWDYNRVNESNMIVEDFSQRLNEMPNSIDMHPSGFTMATGSEDYVVEYAVTDCKLEVLKRIPVKVAIESANGEPVMNTSPVSIVKFSNGGSLLAVVTGRIAQIFEVYNYSYHSEKNGMRAML